MRLNEYIQYMVLMPKITKMVISRIVEQMLFSPNFFITYQKNEILTECITDMIDSVPDAISIIFNRFVYLFFSVLVGIVILSSTKLVFSLIMLLWIILILYTIRSSYKKVSNFTEQTNKYKLNLKHDCFDTLKNVISVKLNTTEFFETENIEKKVDEFIINTIYGYDIIITN
jgi:ABC-type multidrug transport system fused ATPase/permease subunit